VAYGVLLGEVVRRFDSGGGGVTPAGEWGDGTYCLHPWGGSSILLRNDLPWRSRQYVPPKRW
jgi:hypothetical protein